MPISLAIQGAAGRMGKRLIALANEEPDLDVVAAFEHAKHPSLGQDAGTLAGIGEIGIALSHDWDVPFDVAIDFSNPSGCMEAIEHCERKQTPIVVATTGLSDEQMTEVRAAAHLIPVCWAPNMSLAVNLTMKLAQQAAAVLNKVPHGADVEILERHHRYKEDAPSGTALKFGELIANTMGLTKPIHGRHGQCGARGRDEIGYHAIRTGDDPGQHTIVFGMLGETIELTVAASSRDCYAQGALAAAKFLYRQSAGMYSMFDVLDLA